MSPAKSGIPIFVFLSIFLFSIVTFASEKTSIDNFSQDAVGNFPAGWKAFPFQMGKAKRVYSVQSEKENSFLHAEDKEEISTPIFKDFYWKVEETPLLEWRWRAKTLPEGAKENDRRTNDSACGVYVAFGRTSGVGLKYVWSSTLPVGHVWEKEPGKFYIIVLNSGKNGLNQWKSNRVNIMEDFKKYFKNPPSKSPSGIGIMTDGNAVHATASCDYDDFQIGPAK